MKYAKVESDGQGNYHIRDGRDLQEVLPVVVIGHVDPDERVAGDFGTGIELHMPVLEDNSTVIAASSAIIAAAADIFARDLASPTVGVRPGLANTTQARKRFLGVNATLVGGTLANQVLVPALAGFSSIAKICSVWSDTADTYNLVLQDDTDADAVPVLPGGTDVEIKANDTIAPFAATSGAAGDNSGSPPDVPVFHTVGPNLALEVDITGGAGVEELVIFICYWYEAL